MDGQMNIAQVMAPKKRRPCEYSFIRYIGQKVSTLHGQKTIAVIEPYYTIFTDGMVGTPHDIKPIDEYENRFALTAELEYEQWKLSRTKECDCFRTITIKNIEILKELLNERSDDIV